jgi:hypothetical protein
MNLNEEQKKQVLEKNAVIKLETVYQLIKCLDIATNRGAFKGNELSFVGSLYDMLSKGLNQAFEEENKRLEPIKEVENEK